jgi:hypothetical protein
MSDNSDRPPAGAIPLSEFFDPRLTEAVQEGTAYKTSSEVHTAGQARREACEELDRARRAACRPGRRGGSVNGVTWTSPRADHRRNVVLTHTGYVWHSTGSEHPGDRQRHLARSPLTYHT